MKAFNMGFISAGNMAQAIIKVATAKGIIKGENVYAYDTDGSKTALLEESCGINAAGSSLEVCKSCDIIVLAVKPNIMPVVLEEIKDHIENKTLVSIAAGWSAERIKGIAGEDKKVLRLMPNTPLLVGEGMSVFETPSNADSEAVSFIESVFCAIGKVKYAPSKLMDAVTAVSGSGPAYVFMFIEALADAGVLCGLPREMSMTLAAQTVYGASKMVMDTGTHPGALKDAVCSPGGTTIEAVKSLEEDGFRGTIIKAVKKCADKSRKLSEQ